MPDPRTLDQVKSVVVTTLALQDQAESLTAHTVLLDLPELDSLAVVNLLAELETAFAISIEDDEFSAELLETMGSLADFVEAKLADDPATRAGTTPP
ncbi:MAG: acyl carrier protein [Actinomycetales bacterium]